MRSKYLKKILWLGGQSRAVSYRPHPTKACSKGRFQGALGLSASGEEWRAALLAERRLGDSGQVHQSHGTCCWGWAQGAGCLEGSALEGLSAEKLCRQHSTPSNVSLLFHKSSVRHIAKPIKGRILAIG